MPTQHDTMPTTQHDQMIRITERPNDLTSDIDIRPDDTTTTAALPHCLKIVRLLQRSDTEQMFMKEADEVGEGEAGEGMVVGTMFGRGTVDALRRVSDAMVSISISISSSGSDRGGGGDSINGRRRVHTVLSGCGTSGRLAHFCSRSYTHAVQHIVADTGITAAAAAAAAAGHPHPLSRLTFDYLIAGGDRALVRAQENAEDRPLLGLQDLQMAMDRSISASASGDDDDSGGGGTATAEMAAVYVGITCGLSAPYVAGQLHHAMQTTTNTTNTTTVLLGFNPLDMARDIVMEGWEEVAMLPGGGGGEVEEEKAFNGNGSRNSSFRDVAERLAALERTDPRRHIVVNPVVGPEAITGSTRMKGGSATKILLDAAFASAAVRLCEHGAVTTTEGRDKEEEEGTRHMLAAMLSGFEDTCRETYARDVHIAQLIDLAQRSLNSGGHVYYLGVSNAGILGFIDASECPPTYGADVGDVRGFISRGWGVMGNREREEMELLDDEDFRISVEHFERQYLPHLTSKDTVFFLAMQQQCGVQEEHQELFHLADMDLPEGVSCGWIFVTQKQQQQQNVAQHSLFSCGFPADFQQQRMDTMHTAFAQLRDRITQRGRVPVLCEIELTHLSIVPHLHSYAEFAMKLVLNAITTGAHVLKGMTYGNRMINLRVSNNKLFFRTMDIVTSIMGVSEQRARQCVLEAIYHGEADAERQKVDNSVEQHVAAAIRKKWVVPTALLLASGSCDSVMEAHEYLKRDPVVRNVITTIRQQQRCP